MSDCSLYAVGSIPLSSLTQGRKVHAKIDRELNVTSLESPKETKFVPNDITVVEQGEGTVLFTTVTHHA